MSEETNRKGRTREVLAIVGGLGGLFALCYLAVFAGNETALGAVVSTISSIFGFYFAAKTAER